MPDFSANLRRVFSNAMSYFKPEHNTYKAARRLRRIYADTCLELGLQVASPPSRILLRILEIIFQYRNNIPVFVIIFNIRNNIRNIRWKHGSGLPRENMAESRLSRCI